MTDKVQEQIKRLQHRLRKLEKRMRGGKSAPIFHKIECDAPDDCRFTHGPVQHSGINFQPCYNRDGRMVNKDPNTSTCVVTCHSCGRGWLVTQSVDGTDLVPLGQGDSVQ